MAKILVCDPIAQSAFDKLVDMGHIVDELTDEKRPDLENIIADYDAMIVRSATKVRVPLIDKMEKMKVIIRGGVGIDNIDHQHARCKEIQVRNTPAASSDSVAELALAHIFALYRFIPQANITMRNGEWNKKKYKGREVAGKKLGIVGIGRIGKSLARKAIALGMTVVASDPHVTASGIDGVPMADFDELLGTCDIISLHVPGMEKPLIGKAELTRMKKGAILINCARGGVVDEDAMIEALDGDIISGYGVDVYAEEPTKNEKLLNHAKVSCTPHVGATTKEAQGRVGSEICEIVDEIFG